MRDTGSYFNAYCTERRKQGLFDCVAHQAGHAADIATIAVPANRVDNKGVDQFTVAESRERRILFGNDDANSGKVYREALKGQDFTASWRAEYRTGANDVLPNLFNHGMCANFFVSLVMREQGDGSGLPQWYGHCLVATPQPGRDNRGRIYTFTAEGDGGIDVSTHHLGTRWNLKPNSSIYEITFKRTPSLFGLIETKMANRTDADYLAILKEIVIDSEYRCL